jgi:nucleotide-binding universal stress UspA family protein
MNTIVVGYDGSEASERALARAADLAGAFTSRLVVVSVSRSTHVPVAVPALDPDGVLVASPVGGPMAPETPMPLPGSEQAPDPKEHARLQLEHARMTLSRRRVDAEYVAEVGSPAERLLDVAEQRDADLIVVGSPTHGFVERLLARPVDEAVARRAGRDVLLVH